MAPGKDNAESQTADSNLPDIAMWSVRPPETPEQHKWYYTSHMTPNEVLFFKIFDSKNDGTAKRTPHSAFTTQDDFGPPRQSLELRSLVFWEDQLCE